MSEHFDVHQHKNELRVSNANTIYHPERGQLCMKETHFDCYLWHPIIWKKKADAQKWIDSGTIAEIQEALTILEVGFSLKTFEWRER